MITCDYINYINDHHIYVTCSAHQTYVEAMAKKEDGRPDFRWIEWLWLWWLWWLWWLRYIYNGGVYRVTKKWPSVGLLMMPKLEQQPFPPPHLTHPAEKENKNWWLSLYLIIKDDPFYKSWNMVFDEDDDDRLWRAKKCLNSDLQLSFFPPSYAPQARSEA